MIHLHTQPRHTHSHPQQPTPARTFSGATSVVTTMVGNSPGEVRAHANQTSAQKKVPEETPSRSFLRVLVHHAPGLATPGRVYSWLGIRASFAAWVREESARASVVEHPFKVHKNRKRHSQTTIPNPHALAPLPNMRLYA